MDIKKMDFSNEKDGIFKKARKISVLCDAEVSIIMLCNNTELMKKIVDQYQSKVGVDLWSSHYEKMQEELRGLKDVNTTVRREIMQRKGEELDDLSVEELCGFEEEMRRTLKNIRARKEILMYRQMDARRKKVKWLEELHKGLLEDLEKKHEFPGGLVVDEGGQDSADAAAFAGRFHANPARVQQPRNLHRDEEDESSCVTTASTMEVEDSV